MLKLRARILARIRQFFAVREVLEVETPVLSVATTPDPHLHSFATRYNGPDTNGARTFYLQTSPEFAMKRLLAAGNGSIYQICKAFRDEENGRWHNPEFTLLEWYREHFDHIQLMDEVAELVTEALLETCELEAPERLSYRTAFQRYAGIDPHLADVEALVACAKSHDLSLTTNFSAEQIDDWRDLLLTHVVQPCLGKGRLSFIYDYPASQAALARVRPGNPPLAERFELYFHGIELANGFHELRDPREQRRRFEHALARRRAHGLPNVPIDGQLLAALDTGLPDCAGVALGIDRLVMIAAGVPTMEQVLSFPIGRA